ncbi:hypothetical protein ACFXCZ_24760, partial [Streptomyces sp. NPDC059396]
WGARRRLAAAARPGPPPRGAPPPRPPPPPPPAPPPPHESVPGVRETVQGLLDMARGLGLATLLTDDSGRRGRVVAQWSRILDGVLPP